MLFRVSNRDRRIPLPLFGDGSRRFFILQSLLLWLALAPQRDAVAAFASQFSLSTGEEYNDNIFFTKQKEHDFITYVFPTFSLLYAPLGETAPTFATELTPIGQIFARHGGQTNFGDNLRFKSSYTYRYSPRLSFQAVDTLRRLGETRTGLGEGFFEGSGGPGSSVGTGVPPSSSQGLADFTRGSELTNQLSLSGRFAYSPNLSFTGTYTFGSTNFIDQGGSDISHSTGVTAFYNWKQEHNLHAGLTIDIIKSRNGDDNIVHNIDVGDDYLSALKIELTPTLTVSASTGIGLNSNNGGPRIVSRANITATKIWERASLSGGVRKGLTPSFGVSGISDTTSFFTAFNIRITEYLTGSAGVDYSLYDTNDVDFNTFQAFNGLQYRFTSWLDANLRYAYRRTDAGAGAETTDLLTRGKVNSNSLFLIFTARFDVWPNVGLARDSFAH
jgi:hypothetical protein